MQIDWLTGSVATPPELSPGYDVGSYLRLGPGGEVQKRWAAKQTVEAFDGTAPDWPEHSYSRNFTVWTPTEGELFISGNPVKLLQGHNAFGSCDALGLFLEAGIFVRHHAGWFPSPQTWEACEFKGPRFTRIDLTRSYRFPSSAYALEWLRDVAAQSRSRHGGAICSGETVYFGKTSTRWTMKLYEKGGELLKRPSLDVLSKFNGLSRRIKSYFSDVLEWSQGVVRFELTLRSPELEKCAGAVSALRPGTCRAAALELWKQYYDRITWNGGIDMREPDLIEAALPSHLQVKLAAWRSGADLRAMMTRPTFYRVRRELLLSAGVDIAVPPVSEAPRVDVRASLDPAGWDPEPIASRYVDPREELAKSYRLL